MSGSLKPYLLASHFSIFEGIVAAHCEETDRLLADAAVDKVVLGSATDYRPLNSGFSLARNAAMPARPSLERLLSTMVRVSSAS